MAYLALAATLASPSMLLAQQDPPPPFPTSSFVATGARISPLSTPGSQLLRLATGLRQDTNADGGYAVSSAISPDGSKLLVLTTGYNGFYSKEDGTQITFPVLDPVTGKPNGQTTTYAERIFLYDIRQHTPQLLQTLTVPATYVGLTWDATGDHFYVSGGYQDLVYAYKRSGEQFVVDPPFIQLNNGEQLADTVAGPKLDALGYGSGPVVAGLAITKDGSKLYTANLENDSISVVDAKTHTVLDKIIFAKPGSHTATGEYPFWITIAPATDHGPQKVFVSSQRDGQVMVVDDSGQFRAIRVGNDPNKMILSRDGRRLYVANGNSDTISVIDTAQETVCSTIRLRRPQYPYKGADPNSLALSPDQRTLYVTLAGENAVAVVDLDEQRVVGRIPTTWFPNSVSVSPDGKNLYVLNEKGMPGPNPSYASTAPNPTNRAEYILAQERANLLVIPLPNRHDLAELSQEVDYNNGFLNRRVDPTMEKLKGKIEHVIYIVKENRTYDEILGDLPVGDGDPALALFPQAITPNHHKLALDFVTLDRFYDSGDVSGDGWNWTTQARVNDYAEKSIPASYGNGFGTLDVYGTDRNMNMALPDKAAKPSPFTVRFTTLEDPSGSSSILPGRKDIASGDGDGDLSPEQVGGYIWDNVLRAGKTLRHYGYFTDYTYYSVPAPLYIPISRTPYASHIPQGPPVKKSLLDTSDLYYRGFDLNVPDTYHYEEWKREFDGYVANNNLPSFEIMSLPLDHTGSFGSNVGGLSTPTLDIADNDYALAQIVQAVSHSPYWKNTAIFVVEDDAQAGPDHVDAHRSPAYVISAYTKRNTVVHNRYTTVNVMRTMEDLLGLDYLGMFDANAIPMGNVFTTEPDLTAYTAVIPGVLCQPPVNPDLVPECHNPSIVRTAAERPLHDGAWWQQATQRFDFRKPDNLDSNAYNHVLWAGLKGSQPYPNGRSHANLSRNRALLLRSSSPRTRTATHAAKAVNPPAQQPGQ